jgi:chromosome segregation ATPase
MRVRDLQVLEQEIVKEKEANHVLSQERERLQEVAKERTWAQNGLSALSDEHEILQTELESLEQSLMRKEQTAREQAREMQRLEAHNADLESQVQRLMSAHSNIQISSLDAEAELAGVTAAKRDALQEAAVARAELEAKLELLQTLQQRDDAREELLKDKEQRLHEQVDCDKNSRM